ncbi:MAG: hypothetical protein H6744_21665 [Deltaproteobacteria bacterium]|nr:hypothetical protein [Deltaproteobacteria bacterium]MCB9789293.1 hypothetical protein [Deltaproteobacteria bacterium]
MRRTTLLVAVTFISLLLGAVEASAACVELCNGHGLCIQDTCLCDPGYAGEGCQTVEAACPNDCGGRGVCQFGKCFCQAGYAGPDCAENVGTCPGGCGSFGTCVFDQCQCKLGWTGPRCDQPTLSCPGDCSAHGICGDDGACVCDAGYEGADCGTAAPTCPKDCSGRGVCKAGQCFCEPGFGGADCSSESKTCPNGCSGTGVCLNGTCACLAGYDGPDCSGEASCPGDCSGRGVCQRGKCLCGPGYEGGSCEKVTPPCDLCSDRGICLFGGQCLCQPGFEGANCEKTTACPSDCGGRGVCQYGKCFCAPGYQGESCDKPVACPSGCGGRGVCQLGQCFCQPGYEGESCEKETGCPKGCLDNGVCAYGKCFCAPGYSGDDCSSTDFTQLDSIGFDNPIFIGSSDVMVNVLASKAASEVVIQLLDPLSGAELQTTRHLLPSNLVANGVLETAGFSGGAPVAKGADQPAFELVYSLAIRSSDPGDPGVVLIDFPIRALASFLPAGTAKEGAKTVKEARKSAKAKFKAGAELSGRIRSLAQLAGLGAMDADLFPPGSWAEAAERTLFEAGVADAGLSATVLSTGVAVDEQECWDVFTASLAPSCDAAGLPFGAFDRLPKSCRPPGRLQFDYKASKDLEPSTFFLVGASKATMGVPFGSAVSVSGDGSWILVSARLAGDGGFLDGQTIYVETKAAVGGGPATIGQILDADAAVVQVASELGEGEVSSLDLLELPATEPALAGLTLSDGDSESADVFTRRRTKGGFVVDISGIEDFLPGGGGGRSGGGGASGSWGIAGGGGSTTAWIATNCRVSSAGGAPVLDCGAGGGCSIPGGCGGETVIGPEGGTATSADGSASVTFGAGILAKPTPIVVEAVAKPLVDVPRASGVYEFGPHGSTFPKGVELCLTDVSGKVNGDNACLGFLDESTNPPSWKCEDPCLKKKGGTLCGQTDHFTNFALLLGGGYGGNEDVCGKN